MPSRQAFSCAEARHAQYYLTLLRSANERLVQNRENNSAFRPDVNLLDLDWENIQRGQKWASANSSIDPVAANLSMDYSTSGINVMELHLHPRERISWHMVALTTAQKLRSHVTKVLTLNALALDHQQLGEVRRAIEYFEKELSITRGWKLKLGPLHNLGNAYLDIQESALAVHYYLKALRIAYLLGNLADKGSALFQLGRAYFIPNPRCAIHYLLNALRLSRRAGDWSTENAVLALLGQAYVRSKGANRAIQFYQKQLEKISEGRNPRSRTAVLGYLSEAYSALGDLERAIELCSQQLQIARDISDWRLELEALGYLASNYAKLGEPRRAIDYYLQQLSIIQVWGDWRKEGGIFGDLAKAYEEVGEIDDALVYYEKVLQISRSKGAQFWEATLLSLIGYKYDLWGNRLQAIANIKSALRVYESIDAPFPEQVEMLRKQLDKWIQIK